YMAGGPDGREELDEALATLAGASAAGANIALARSDDPARAPAEDLAWLSSAREGGALLDRFGIAFAILPASVAMALKAPTLDTRGAWSLVELPVAQPASVMRGWSWAVADADALDLTYPIGGGTGILRGTTVLRGTGASQADRGPPLPCAIERWRPGDVELACTTDARGYAVVSSAPSRGWSVAVDDRAAAWLAADVLRRAVEIEPGAHRIRWTYATPGLTAGLALGLAGAAGLVVYALLHRRRRDS
ncbi:MAG: YfhO family protein, partial [Deltaproteobacteria bacterium]|nr:YfhO family protein [Deltaproteobacteria bacterium]